MDDVYNNIDDYHPNKSRKILIDHNFKFYTLRNNEDSQ